MNKKHSKLSTIFSFVLVGILLVLPFIWHPNTQNSARTDGSLSFNKRMTLGGTEVHVAVASNVIDRARGLSDTTSLAPNEGMLFVFNEESIQSFWMKDMRYPLDIIWIGSDLAVKEVHENLDPQSYPTMFSPKIPVLYALEVSAGFVKANSIEIGTMVSF